MHLYNVINEIKTKNEILKNFNQKFMDKNRQILKNFNILLYFEEI